MILAARIAMIGSKLEADAGKLTLAELNERIGRFERVHGVSSEEWRKQFAGDYPPRSVHDIQWLILLNARAFLLDNAS